MNLLQKIELKHKLSVTVVLLFGVFGVIGYFAYAGNEQMMINIEKLLDNLRLQNSINSVKDNITLDYQKNVELASQVSEADIEEKWKEHQLLIDRIHDVTKEIAKISSEEALEIVEIKNVYENLILPSYREVYKLKLKEQLLESELSDSAGSANIQKLHQEIRDVSDGVKNKIKIVQNKLDAVSEKAEQNLVVNLEALKLKAEEDLSQLIMFYVIAALIATLFIVLFFGLIFRSIGRLKVFIGGLRSGDLDQELEAHTHDEIGHMIRSMNTFVASMREIAKQLNEIGEANFSSEYKLLSAKDQLGKAFLKMKDNLQSANEQAEKLREQEAIQNWATTGVAKFGDILRAQTDDNQQLGYNIIKGLIEYLNANQGGVFIVNDENSSHVYLELMATYAYGRRKFKQKEVNFGSGLVGTCAVEGQTIFMTNIPEDYIEIESYLGSANPKSLLLVPLRLDNEIFGVIEIASFNEFKDHEIKFVEDLAETIASTISTAKINAKTADLLEKSRLQSETMLAQEEEMRQNLEELQSTQEEASRREKLLREELDEAHAELSRLKRQLEQ